MKKDKSVWHIITLYKINSIFVKYFTMVFLMFVVPISSISIAISFYIQSNSEKDVRSAYEQSLIKIFDSMDMFFDDISKLSIRLAADSEIDSIISNNGGILDYEWKKMQDSIQSKISLSLNEYVDSIYLYSSANNQITASNGYYSQLSDFYDNSWEVGYVALKQGVEKFIKFRTGVKRSLLAEPKSNYITFLQVAPINSLLKSGAVIINVDVGRFDSFIRGENTKTIDEVYIIDNTNTVVYSKTMEHIGDSAEMIPYYKQSQLLKGFSSIETLNGQKKLIVHNMSEKTGYSYISVVSIDNTSNKAHLRTVFTGFLIAGFIFSALFAFAIAWSVYRPYGDIISIINNPGKGDLIRFTRRKRGLNELRYIFSAISSINLNKRDLEATLSQNLTMLKKSQTIALQSQINPHFLYNTLNAIKWMVMEYTHGENEASKAITTLSQLLRLSLETTDNLNSIRNEIEHAKKYISIEKLRFENMFDVTWDIPEEHMEYMIVKLTLQPLIENAIYHGIKMKSDKGMITIRTEEMENSIILYIEDNGSGMDDTQVDRINNELLQESLKEDRNIGLKNVSQRIHLVFGGEYGVHISSVKNVGTQVKIFIPKVK